MRLSLNCIPNKLKNTLRLGVICILLKTLPVAQAIEIEGTGIDWEASTMQVEFTAENAIVPDFSCFDITPTPSESVDGPCASYSGGADHCVWSNLDTLGYSDENSEPLIDNCFQQAGNYIVTVELTDFAKNTSDPEISTFTVKAGSPDQDQSVFELSNCAIGDENANGSEEEVNVANGSDVCTLLLKVRDQYGNPVTQLKNYAAAKIYSDSDFPTDANRGISFRNGLRLATTDLLGTSASPTTFTLSNTNEVSEQFQLSAWAPSTEEVAAFLGKNKNFQLDLSIKLPGINSSGGVDVGNPIIFQYEKYSPSIRFRPPARTKVAFVNEPEFIIDVATPMKLVRLLTPGLDPALTGNIDGSTDHSIITFLRTYLRYHNLPHGLKWSTSSPDSTAFFTPNLHNFFAVATDLIDITPKMEIASPNTYSLNPLSFSTEVEYQTPQGIIRYPSGAFGSGFGVLAGEVDDLDDTNINVRMVGVSIEGNVLLTAGGANSFSDNQHLLLGTNDFKDVRESILKNATRITRGIPAQLGGSTFSANWFSSSTVALVTGDVYIKSPSGADYTNPAETVLMPIGKNTLVIEDGNLYVEDNMAYANTLDSMGIILINSKIEPYPEKGNIFVRTNVQRMVGTYFAEGGFMSNDKVNPNIHTTPSDHSNGLTTNDKQLLLEGTILTHNTIGGGLLAGTELRNPWGATGEVNGVTPQERGIAYDLHYVRRFAPEYPSGGGAMTNSGDCYSSPCDTNLNAFVIKVDGKVGALTPPGFSNVSTIRQ